MGGESGTEQEGRWQAARDRAPKEGQSVDFTQSAGQPWGIFGRVQT